MDDLLIGIGQRVHTVHSVHYTQNMPGYRLRSQRHRQGPVSSKVLK